MKTSYIIIFLLMLMPLCIFAEDYEYQYFNGEKEKYVPFSDYIPRVRLHYKTVPHYVEDYYQLYGMKQYYNENSLRKNIERLKTALQCKFRHPSEALVKVESEKEYKKYRKLMFMRINLLIMRNHMTIASRYDKQKIYFYNLEFSKDIRDSLDTADRYYREALPYWNEARRYAHEASRIKITTELSSMESERSSIIKNDLNYEKIITSHLKKVDTKKKKLDKYLASGQ